MNNFKSIILNKNIINKYINKSLEKQNFQNKFLIQITMKIKTVNNYVDLVNKIFMELNFFHA